MKFTGGKKPGLLPENILIACVAENREPYITEAYYLFCTLIHFGGRVSNAKKIAYFVGAADAEAVEKLAGLGVIVKVVEPVDKRCPHANKLAMLNDLEEEYDIIFMLDCDIVVTKDFMDVLDTGTVMVKPVDNDPLEIKDWEKIFGLFSLKLPKERFSTTFQNKETIPYFNSGVISVPAKYARTLSASWKKNIDKLFDIYETHPEIAAHKFFADQFAFALTLQAEKIPFRALPVEMNTPIHSPIHRSFNPESLEPYILHHHHLFSEKGIFESANVNINKIIRKLNEALRAPLPEITMGGTADRKGAFDNREFWDSRYKNDLNLGSGVGSRGELLAYKKSILNKMIGEIGPDSVLDVGCGDMELTKDFQFNRYHGIDISEVIVERNRLHSPERLFSCGDLLALSAGKDLSSDMVTCFDVLIHQPDADKYRQMVEKMVSLTRVAGLITGFELPPREKFRSEITFYHEPITQTLRKAGALDIQVIGYYRDLSVIRFSAENKTKKINTNSKAICILGMHRSGTSAITRAINLLGAYLGEEKDLMAPGPDNPEGYWERNDIVALDDRILNQFKRAWNANLPLPDGWYLSSELRPLRKEIVELVNKNFKYSELWAWKDPRTSIVFELWKDVLKELGVNLVCLLAVRNPLDVAKSLEKRDGFTRDRGYGIWFNYNIAALKASADIPRVFVAYDRFMGDWETELKRCADGLGVKWPEDDSFLRDKMKEFIRPTLRHSASGLTDLKEAKAPLPVIELYELLETAMNTPSSPDTAFDAKIKHISEDFSEYARFFQHMARLWEYEQQFPELTRQLAEKDRQIEGLLNSYSWKATAPLRKLLGAVKK